MPRRGLLVGMRNFENGRFPKWLAQKLKADGELRGGAEPTRNADAANPRQIAGNRENVRKIHLDRVIGFLPGLECGGGRCGGDDRVHLLKCI